MDKFVKGMDNFARSVIFLEEEAFMSNFCLALENIPRLNPFCLPVKYIGYDSLNTHRVRQTHKTINIGFTISSKAKYFVYSAEDSVYKFKIPCFVFNLPGPYYENKTLFPVELFYMTYDAAHIESFRFLTSLFP